MALSFGDGLELDIELFELRRDGTQVPLEPQAFDVLSYLVSHRDRVVPKEELMDAIWGGRFVAETAVTSRIKQVRRALGDDGRAQQLVRTVHGRGYRFVASVRTPPAAADDAAAVQSQREALAAVRYTVSDGLHIAYQVTGVGEPDVVLISGFVSHLELDWGNPQHQHFLDRLGAMGRLIRFDKRGTGMSDRPPGVPDLETRMHDVLAVMDAVRSRRAVVCGYSEGGPMAVLLAATHPERVSSLVLYGSYAKRTSAPDYPWAMSEQDRAAYADRLVGEWDWEADCRRRSPSADAAMQRWWAQRMRAAATPSTVRALMDMNALVDVRDILPSVRVPTLVVHRMGDPFFHPDEARYIAERIPGARLSLLHGGDHLPWADGDQILDEVEAFLADLRNPTEPPLALAAVAAVAGDDSGAAVTDLLSRGGRLRHDQHGRPVVLFDGPARAVRAGLDLVSERIRMGLSIAELPRDLEPVAGDAVTAALRLADGGLPGTVSVSATAAMLLSGSGVVVEDAGVGEDGEPVLRVALA